MKTARVPVADLPADLPAELAPARKLKVAVLSRVFSRTGGGAEAYSIAVVEHLAASHEVHVFAQEIAHQHDGVQYHRVSSPGKRPRWLNQLWFAIATWHATRRGFDVVHSHENTWHGQIQTIHVRPLRSNVLGERTGWRRAAAWLKIALSPRLLTYVGLEAARCAPQPNRHIAVASNSLGREVAAMYPHAQRMMTVIAPGVAPALSPLPNAHDAKAAFGIAPDKQVLLFVANDYARKGLDALLKALAQLPPQATLLVVGQSGAKAAYADKALALGLRERVVFAGPLQAMGPAYAAADVLVHPTLEDSFGMVVLEAMAHGVPVVVSGPAYCGAADLLTHEVNALLLHDPKDDGELAQHVTRVLCDADFAATLAKNGKRLAAEHSWQAVADRYAQLYLQVCNSK